MSSLHLNILSTLSPTRSSFGGSKPPTPVGGEEEIDTLARESDVIVSSTNITSNPEYKGFFVYVLTAIGLGCYIAWTILPESVLQNQLSIYYYPDKYWSLAIPAYSLMSMLFMYIFLALYITEVKTLPLDDIRNFVDDYSTTPGLSKGLDPSASIDASIDYIHKAPSGVWDLPITLVNEVLYTNDEDNDDDNKN
ncbi:PIG-P-domain-containing protein [Scheffersomyces coipomensis]|uniref:PIG-P-domain-containing protein n=1 Tax=Scheffersomyces coipomensis TaxID=1788519 RepID=UPI00315C9B7C